MGALVLLVRSGEAAAGAEVPRMVAGLAGCAFSRLPHVCMLACPHPV